MKVDFLTSTGIKIKQTDNCCHFTSDAVTLGDFVRCRPTDTVIDAGCGNGVISLMLYDKFKCKVIAVDIDEHAAKLAQENITLNDLDIKAFRADIREFHKTFGANLADVLVCNPPYFSTGSKSRQSARAGARHDDTLSLADLATAATRLLKYGGAFYICYPLDQISRVCQVLENHDFRVKELKVLPHLVLAHAKKSKGRASAKVIF